MADRIVLEMAHQGESLTSRDGDGRIIAREAATREKFKKMVKLKIDGHDVTVPLAVPAKDYLGNIVRDADGFPKPRATTIYDAAQELVEMHVWTKQDLKERIPVLCHRDHLDPVAVCRLCSVHICKFKRSKGGFAPDDRLAPACQQEVQDKIEITTRKGGTAGDVTEKYAALVAKSIGLVTELLAAENLRPQPADDVRCVNELAGVAQLLNVGGGRPAFRATARRNTDLHPASRPLPLPLADDRPYSSRTITVDHDLCILCDRCVRSCSDVKPFKVIGHTGKGYGTRISFDLDLAMNDSSCVQCGECMTACPTGALTFKRRVAPRAFTDAPPIPEDPRVPLPAGYGFLTAEEMMAVELEYKNAADTVVKFAPFHTIPFAFLKWNEGAVRRRAVKAGEILCRQGQYGSTAFFLKSGKYEILSESAPAPERPGFFGRVFGAVPKAPEKNLLGEVGPEALILGELACLSNRPRKATIRVAADGEIYEVTRNLLDMAQRSKFARDVLAEIYTRNAVRACLREGRLFAGLSKNDVTRAAAFLERPGGDLPRAELRRAEPGEIIVAEGAPGKDFYIIRTGTVKVAQATGAGEQVIAHLGENSHFGEIALLLGIPRTASIVALDPVETVCIPEKLFLALCEAFPDLKTRMKAAADEIRKENLRRDRHGAETRAKYLGQGLFQGQKMLALDLVSCTRCDECTRACAASHGDGISRLLRDGERFGDFLVATSCRSCLKPYCMDGCPVDAIHREGATLEVRIDAHCIGCGLCEKNCPYGAIQMAPKVAGAAEKGMTAAVAKRAVNCDLCHGLVPQGADPFCVAACPHDAAFRWDGETLLKNASR